MIDTPLITIGITCYNAADLIHRAIDSALSQSWPNVEIIIVDDASTDNSVQVIEEYCAKNPHITLIKHEKNKGFPSALNTIFEHAKGEYVALFDDDDVSLPERLSKQYERLSAYEQQKQSDLVFCYTNRDVFSDIAQKAPSYQLKAIGRQLQEPHGTMVSDYLLWSAGEQGYVWGMFGSCTLMIKRQAVIDLGGFDPEFRRCAEWDLAIRAGFKGAHFIAVDENLIQQLKTPTADKSNKIPLKYAMMLRHKHKQYLTLKGMRYYWGALLMARARFAGSKGQKLIALCFRAMNYLLTLNFGGKHHA